MPKKAKKSSDIVKIVKITIQHTVTKIIFLKSFNLNSFLLELLKGQ
jgi:hypothetical protein